MRNMENKIDSLLLEIKNVPKTDENIIMLTNKVNDLLKDIDDPRLRGKLSLSTEHLTMLREIISPLDTEDDEIIDCSTK